MRIRMLRPVYQGTPTEAGAIAGASAHPAGTGLFLEGHSVGAMPVALQGPR